MDSGGTIYEKICISASGRAVAHRGHPFGGGGGAGVKVTPVCFLVVSGTNVRVLPTAPYPESSLDRVLDLIPDAVGKVSEFLEKKKDKGTDEALDDVFVE